MTYSPGIPNSNDLISQSQAQIKTNFTNIDSATTGFAVDHVTLTDNTNGGKHKKVTFLAPIANPGQTTPISSLYTKASATTSTSDLYYQDGALAADVKQLTGGGITAAAWAQFNGTTVGTNAPNQGYNVTSVTRNSAGSYTINFTRHFTTINYGLQALPSINGSGISIQITSRTVSACTFVVRNVNTLTDSNDCNVVFFGVLT